MSTESTFLLVQCLQVSPLTPAWMARKMSSSSCTNCAISCRTLKKVAEKLAFEAYVGEKLAFCFRITLLPCTTSHCVMWCTRLYKTGWPLNLKWITFCWSRPGKCLPLDEGSACVRNGGILHNDYFDFIYDRLATREKKKNIDGGSPLLACPDGSSLFETAPFQAPLEFHPRPMSPMSLQ